MLDNINANQFYIQLINWGLYVARYSISYSIAGGSLTTITSDNILIGGMRRLYFPSNASKLIIKMEVLYFFTWIDFYNETFNYGDVRTQCFICYGGVILPFVSRVSCDNSINQMNELGIHLQNQFLINSPIFIYK